MSCQSTFSGYQCNKPRRKPCPEPCNYTGESTLTHSILILFSSLDPLSPIRGILEAVVDFSSFASIRVHLRFSYSFWVAAALRSVHRFAAILVVNFIELPVP